MNRDVFDLTESGIFNKPKKIRYDRKNLLKEFGLDNIGNALFTGKLQEYHEIYDKSDYCPECGKKKKGLECHCIAECDRCGVKLKYDEICLCKKCEQILKHDIQKKQFLNAIRGINT